MSVEPMISRAAGLRLIPTKYAGRMFRSRAEARWAIAFDHADIEWNYEPEGYQLPSFWYLPDFWLPRIGCFAEVKGVATQWDAEAITKARELAAHTRRPVLMLTDLMEMPEGMPWVPFVVAHDRHVGLELIDLLASEEKGHPFYQWDDPRVVDAESENWRFERKWADAQYVAANFFLLPWQR